MVRLSSALLPVLYVIATLIVLILLTESYNQADAQGRATALTTNLLNTGFYNSLGFVEKGRILLGDNNPTWHEPPVVLLVVRI